MQISNRSCYHFADILSFTWKERTCIQAVREAWRRSKGYATIPASSQLPKIHSTQRPLICIINVLIVPRGHQRVSVKRVAFQFANGAALSRNESNRYVRWYGWRVTRLGNRSLIEHRGLKSTAANSRYRRTDRVTVPKEIDWSHWLFPTFPSTYFSNCIDQRKHSSLFTNIY